MSICGFALPHGSTSAQSLDFIDRLPPLPLRFLSFRYSRYSTSSSSLVGFFQAGRLRSSSRFQSSNARRWSTSNPATVWSASRSSVVGALPVGLGLLVPLFASVFVTIPFALIYSRPEQSRGPWIGPQDYAAGL